MLRINQIICPISHTEKQLFAALCAKLKCKEADILSWQIAKRSIDARKKPRLFYSYTLLAVCKNEGKLLKRLSKDRDVIYDTSVIFSFQVTGQQNLIKRPLIIGAGPAGLFCTLELARAGFRPILLERGKNVDERCADVEAFWNGKPLLPDSNVQFGEGGAGAFSDGKLNTLIKDKYGLNTYVLKTFVEFGGEESILYDPKPHLGTDVLKNIVKNIRQEIISFGGDVRFSKQMTDIRLSEENHICAIEINGEEWLETDVLVLAIGHSARDTLSMLYKRRLSMEAKPFAVGFRVQHPQRFINETQYGSFETPLGAAPYKLTAKAKDGRSVYSFCMCPGGYVINASSEEGLLAVNGMSYSDRSGDCANSAVIVAVTPKDYGNADCPLSGISFQRELERRAYEAAQGKIPVQKYGAYWESLAKQGILKGSAYAPTDILPSFTPACKGFFKETDLTHILPPTLNIAFVDGMEEMNRKIRGFASAEVWLCGIESRTSSPVRIMRDDSLQSSFAGIYPCGEGAGYAGGITSAATDGIKVAEKIAGVYRP